MNTTGIHDHRNAIELTHEHRETMALNGNRLGGKSVDVAVRDMTHNAHPLAQRAKAAAQHNRHGMLHSGLAMCRHLLKVSLMRRPFFLPDEDAETMNAWPEPRSCNRALTLGTICPA